MFPYLCDKNPRRQCLPILSKPTELSIVADKPPCCQQFSEDGLRRIQAEIGAELSARKTTIGTGLLPVIGLDFGNNLATKFT
ncbi:MAG: hypothetical protein WCE49_09405 [Terrimicrobiaceae bacterium]